MLESILSSEACKNGLPSIEDLLKHSFFARVILNVLPNDKVHFKVSNGTRDNLKQLKVQIEERLKEEQKVVRSQKRIARVQEMMTSEEEKKKQRHKIVRIEFLMLDKSFTISFAQYNGRCKFQTFSSVSPFFCFRDKKRNWPKRKNVN